MPHIRNGEYPYHGWTRDFPHTSFPTPRDGLDFPEQDIWWVHPTDQPEHDPETQMIVEGAPEQIDGQWRQTWEVVPRPPDPVPQSVTRAQGKAALIQAGLWSAVVAYVEAIEDDTERALAEVALNDTLEWQRSSPFLNAAAAALGMTDEQLDDLFRQAATIEL